MALEEAKGLKTINEIASEHNLHPNQVSSWKKQFLEERMTAFGSCSCRPKRDPLGR